MSKLALHDTLFDLPAPGAEVSAAVPAAQAELSSYPDVELLDRMRTLRDTAGFLPTSRGEINEAFTLLSYLHEPGATARHLNEVLLHQQKPGTKTGEPAAAVRSITREYAGYAGRARTDRFSLASLRQELQEYSGNPLSSLKSLGASTGTGQFVRYYDLSRLAADGTAAVQPFIARSDKRRSALDPYTAAEPSREIQTHLEEVLGQIRVWDARQSVDAMVADQQHRFDFWTDRLREARSHYAARPVATAALEGFGVTVDS